MVTEGLRVLAELKCQVTGRTRGEVGLRLRVHGGRVYSLWLTMQNHHSLLLFAHFDPIGRPIKKQAAELCTARRQETEGEPIMRRQTGEWNGGSRLLTDFFFFLSLSLLYLWSALATAPRSAQTLLVNALPPCEYLDQSEAFGAELSGDSFRAGEYISAKLSPLVARWRLRKLPSWSFRSEGERLAPSRWGA